VTCRVLVVDDDPDIRDTLVELLTLEGFEATPASDGIDALDKLRGPLPCIVLLDILMPRMDGAELYRRMQADSRLASVPVLISTSDPERAPPGLPVLRKPVDVGRLLVALRRPCPRHPQASLP
jgi:CheY-like chemotaxis protein